MKGVWVRGVWVRGLGEGYGLGVYGVGADEGGMGERCAGGARGAPRRPVWRRRDGGEK